jgi:cytochrome c553
VARLVAETSKFADLAASGKLDEARAQAAPMIEACFSCHGGPGKSGGKFRYEAS